PGRRGLRGEPAARAALPVAQSPAAGGRRRPWYHPAGGWFSPLVGAYLVPWVDLLPVRPKRRRGGCCAAHAAVVRDGFDDLGARHAVGSSAPGARPRVGRACVSPA